MCPGLGKTCLNNHTLVPSKGGPQGLWCKELCGVVVFFEATWTLIGFFVERDGEGCVCVSKPLWPNPCGSGGAAHGPQRLLRPGLAAAAVAGRVGRSV